MTTAAEMRDALLDLHRRMELSAVPTPALAVRLDALIAKVEAETLAGGRSSPKGLGYGSSSPEDVTNVGYTGTYSRYFLIPKAPRSERVLSDGRRSPHPTQKPEALIRHLVKLVTPPGGLCLDPFLGSGTLGVVCDGLGMRWLGIERDETYASWAEDRIADGRPAWMTSA